jgi:enoyl-CoA hydratase
MQSAFESMEAAPQVVIASVNGFALAGGFELALACDIIVADEGAELGDEHIRHNLIAGGGSSQRLPRVLGLPRALYYLLTGRRMTGAAAVQMGLAALAVPAAELSATTLALASELAKTDGNALSSTKHMARRGVELPLKEGLALERLMQYRYRAASPGLDRSVKAFGTPQGRVGA